MIGSGAGGLTAAVALARAGQKVLVLEQHYLPGGWCHSFNLGGHRFSPGIHYLGDLGPNGQLRGMLQSLGVLDGSLQFDPINPDGFDHYLIGGERFDQPRGIDRWVSRLGDRFPAEREGIARYFKTLKQVAADLQAMGDPKLGDYLAAPFKLPRLLRSLGGLIDSCVKEPLLKAVLAGQVGNHGLAPSRTPLAIHAMMASHYFEGGWYPRGGSKQIVKAFIGQLKAHGGAIRTRARVQRILVEKGRACGVELEGGERIDAHDVIANADPAVVYTQLLDERYRGRLERKAHQMEYSTPMVSGFCAVDLDLEAMGYDSGNYWLYRDADLDGVYTRAATRQPGDELELMFLSISSLKDRSHRAGPHTVELLTPAMFAPMERGEAYAAHKKELGEKLLAAAERIIPGFRSGLKFFEVGTAQTNVHFCNAWRGAAYGTAKTRWQIGPFGFNQRGPIKGLTLCGASTLAHGYAGASFSGLIAAQQVLNLPKPDAVLGHHVPPQLAPAHA
ncbi:MAG: NAD(P)/FAD-dependent oxidoreductase [Myxococcaceae bacterium]|nr:NAD(P)/FAD-dependent oxidoreductase [Myxococcaceae bacterium]